MRSADLDCTLTPLPGAIPAWRSDVDSTRWRAIAQQVNDQRGRLFAVWGSDARRSGRQQQGDQPGGGFAVHAAFLIDDALLWLTLSGIDDLYPGISEPFPAAGRMQRAIADLFGIHANEQAGAMPWLRHGAWPADRYPLRRDFGASGSYAQQPDLYRFVRVEGDGVHEIPVGPVHAGTIEPGHFRFSVIGERVLRLEERLGYTHKGIEKRFEAMTLSDGAKLAGRISGDSTVAYAWAYAMAVESATGVTPPPRALWLRALFLERERIANHLGDLGFLGNDAGFAFGLMQFSRMKEDMLRTNASLFGHRYLMDAIVPGGVVPDVDDGGIAQLRTELAALASGVALMRGIYDNHAGLQDRLMTTGIVTPELAERLGLTGLAARASGQPFDLRVQFPVSPYDVLGVKAVTQPVGDVAARVAVRFDEVLESLRLSGAILDQIPAGEFADSIPKTKKQGAGIGCVEGWRGPVLIALETAPGNRITRLHPHDPSWQNWPALAHAVIGNIVPDFPLINKSFNLSYSGHDL
ncbi:MAG: NADH-quinone oxidoreductase subunit C [Betaproteobacteria bacterium]